MSEKKTIQINPDLFKISTQAKQKSRVNKPIRMKNTNIPKNKTVRNQIMKMIRTKQQEKYKELFDDKDISYIKDPISPTTEFKKEFNQSLEYLSDLAKKDTENVPKNYTLKNSSPIPCSPIPSSPIPSSPISSSNYENISLELPNVFDNIIPSVNQDTNPSIRNTIPLAIPKINLPPPPPYGVLKVGGTKPTYRTWNTTMKNRDYITGNPNSIENIKKTSVLKQKMDIQRKEQEEKDKNKKQKIRYLKRKKIYKRTYRVGRSKFQPKIGVLVSNKTIRSNISTKTQLLKQESIQDIKKFLVKKGFIKVGTPTPNDILRKMYESVVLICGEVQNHNPENLLYNFIHDDK
jgi:hypothetical protein